MKKLLLTFVLTTFTLVGFSQSDVDRKLSITTQMFLNELNGKIDLNPSTTSKGPLGNLTLDKNGPKPTRLIATPDTIDGKVYISSFLRLQDSNDIAELEALGVVIQTKFINGLVTALVPVEKIEEVAAISNVSRINVASLMRHYTDAARTSTNVDDLLTYSDDARAAGLSKGYDGTGVLLGVIDTGIDFNHIAFKDKNGNSRIKSAYVYNGSIEKEYSSGFPSTDDKTEDHGTHTSTTAGGSSVKVSGTTVTVTDDHANATYGGMAPGANLYLAGVNGLEDTYLSNAFDKIIAYADQNNLPVVVSNSWGSQYGPHDGTGDFADVTAKYFGDSHPNHICLFAASNDADNSKDGEGGGYHLSGTTSSNSPLRSILRCNYYIDTDAGCYYAGIIANAWCRSANVSSITCKIHVLNANTGKLLTTITVDPDKSSTVSGLSSYFSGTLYAFKDYVSSNKTQVMLYTDGLTSRSTSTTTRNGATYYLSNYTLAVEFYPASGSATIDVWGGSCSYFTNYLTTTNYDWKAGDNDMSVSDEAMSPNVISIGAYVTKNKVTNYKGTTYNYSDEFTMGDIAPFSSYATAAASPDGRQYPWITAPGARLVAGVNHNHTTSVNSNSYYGSNFNYDLVVNSTSSPYAAMQGTSMATPVAAGIVALWLQAAKEVGKEMTVNDIKEVMRETAINDYYTTSGPNASHFGHGKIDALAGIKYILGASSQPTINATPTSLAFDGYATKSYTQKLNVKGLHLEGKITATLNDPSRSFSIDKTSITAAEAAQGVDITVTWSPSVAGQTSATITLSAQDAENVVVSLTGTAQAATPTIIADKTEVDFGNCGINQTSTQTIHVSGRFLAKEVNVTLTDANGVFTVSPATLLAADVNEGADITVTFSASEDNSYTGSIVLSSEGAEQVTIALSATASDGGTATDLYLNMAKYATIDDAGWNTKYVNKLYAYTENTDEHYAWVTMPVYGAWVGCYYDSHPQKWIYTNVTSNYNKYAGTTWNANDVLKGSSNYFTKSSGDGSARVMGYNARRNYTQETITFCVTNTTAVKLLGTGQSQTQSTYPATMKIYECEINADGSVKASSTATQSFSNSATSGTFVLATTDELDATKTYKVEVGTYCSYLCEIGFKTPLKVKVIGDLNKDGKVNVLDVTALIDIVLQDDMTAPFKMPQYDHQAADLNGDTKINVLDVTMLIDIILKQ